MHAGPARRTEQKGSRNPSRPLFCTLPDAGPSVGMLPVSYKSQTPLHAHQGVQRGLVMRSAFVLRLMPKTISLPFSCLARLSLDALRVLCPAFSFASPLAVCAVSISPPFMSALAGLLRAADQPVHGDVKRPGEGKQLGVADMALILFNPGDNELRHSLKAHELDFTGKPRRNKRSQIRFRSAGAYDSPAFTLATKILSPPPAG